MTSDSVVLNNIREEIKNSVDYVNKLFEKRAYIESIGNEIIARVQVHVDRHIAALGVLNIDEPLRVVLNESVGILKKGIIDEGHQLSKSTGTSEGCIEGLKVTLTIIDNLEQKVADEAAAVIEKENQQKNLEKKVADGIIDENTPHRPGTRPEGLKNIRKAKSSIKKSETDSKHKPEKSS